MCVCVFYYYTSTLYFDKFVSGITYDNIYRGSKMAIRNKFKYDQQVFDISIHIWMYVNFCSPVKAVILIHVYLLLELRVRKQQIAI